MRLFSSIHSVKNVLGLLRCVPEMSCRRRRGSTRAFKEPASEPCHAAVDAGVGDGAVVGGAVVWRGPYRLHGSLRQMLRGAHAFLQP